MKKCFICNGDPSHYCDWEKFEYVKCNDCGLVYVETLPTEEEMYAAYDGGKWKNLRRKLVSPFRKLEHFSIYDEKMQSTGKLLDIAQKHVSTGKDNKMLDIGCNKGFLLTTGVERGFTPYGIELVPVLMEQFKRKFKKYKTHIHSDNFSYVSEKFPENFFQLITAIDLIEHFQNPREDFENVFRILDKGGVFLVQTPDTQSKESIEQVGKWTALRAYEHLILFDNHNLELLAKQIGFSKIDLYPPVDIQDGNLLAVMTK